MGEPSVDIRLVELSRLQPAPWNPRTIKEERFQNLCASIQADPGFLWRRPILAMADGTIYAGNMRYRAAAHLGMRAVPAIVEDVPEQLAKERALRDNHQWGDWQDDQLGTLLAGLAASESDLSLLGIDEAEMAWMLEGGHGTGSQGGPNAGIDPPRNLGRGSVVKAVLTPFDVSLFEHALRLTGLSNRAEALRVILEEYVAAKGQPGLQGEGLPADLIKAFSAGPAHRSRNARR